MKILNTLTLKNLKLNRKRTIVTIIGISLSVALICAITTFAVSFQNSMIERETKTNGNYHIHVQNVSKENQKYLENNAKIEKLEISQEIGYAVLDDSKNENKPYAYIEGYDDALLQNGGIILIEGRLPENENEIVIPEHVIQNGKINLDVGETIELNIGNRYKGEYILNQSNPYYTEQDRLDRKENGIEDDLEQENFVANMKKTYTIVGIMERLNSESYSAPGYTIITKLEQIDESKNINASIVLKDPAETYNFEKYLKNDLKINENNISKNEQLLYYMGVFKSSRVENFVVTMLTIVIAIIVFTSAFVIKNSFNISLTEKTRELGMIASVGATAKQIRKSIFFEGAILGIISIPLGIILGIVAIGIVLAIVNGIIHSGSSPLIDNFELHLTISVFAIIIAVIISVIMIIISLMKPSYRAGKISPIDAIRENSDIKVKKNKHKNKSYKLTKKLFGIEGVIARKNFRRSKKKYRTTIFSIFLSIVLFISMNAFAESVFGISSLEYQDSRINLTIYTGSNKEEEKENYFNQIKNLDGIKEYAILKNAHVYIDNQKLFTKKALDHYSEMNSLIIYSIGDEAYKNYVKELGMNYDDVKDEAILCDTRLLYEYEDGKDGVKRVETNLLNLNAGDTLEYYNMMDEEGILSEKGNIKIAKRADKYPLGSLFSNDTNPIIIISDEMMQNFDNSLVSMNINAEDPYKVQEEIIKIDKTNKDNIYNVEEDVRAAKNMNLIVSIFVYGFIAVISIIGVTNIFNTITTNMALRNREFAILKSIGMTNKEFKKMIHYESFIYGLKALIFGLPVGIALSYLIYTVTADVYTTSYELPIIPIFISIIFVFVIIFMTMRYAVKKTKNQNIIETIRKENI